LRTSAVLPVVTAMVCLLIVFIEQRQRIRVFSPFLSACLSVGA
jgi:hypothetical protein